MRQSLRLHPSQVLAFAFIAALLSACGPAPAPPPPAPPEVEVAQVQQKDVPITEEWIGTLDGFVNAQIRPQVTGYLARQDYLEGSTVHKGQLLFEIDPRQFQATYDQAKANFDKAEQDLKRQTELFQTAVASREDFDNAVAADRVAKAALEQAQLDLDFTRITSPIDGVAGLALTQIGDLVGPSTGILTTVSTIDPIKVYFSISEESYLTFEQARKPELPGFPDGVDLELVLSNGATYPLKGKFFAADRQVDSATGTLRIAGVFPNPERLLRPGQYGRVRAVVRVVNGAIVVPQRAVSELQGSYQVAVVDGGNHAHLRNVQPGERIGSEWVIESGLGPTDRIVVEGIQKVKDGAEVDPQPFAGR